MWVDFQIHFLSGLDVKEREWRSSTLNHTQRFGVSRVIEPIKLAIINTKAVLPHVKYPGYARRG